jgi:hypothetical protein
MPFSDLDPRVVAVLRGIASSYADRFAGESLFPSLQQATRAPSPSLKEIRAAFAAPYRCLLAFYAHYAFARRGREREEMGSIAAAALKRTCGEADFPRLLRQEDGSELWRQFQAVCAERGRKSHEQLNRGLIAGMLELAQEVYQLDGVGSIAGWIVQSVMQTGQLEAPFLRIVDIRGVGPKTTSTFLRDTAFLFGMEDQIDPQDRLYLQPVDKWLRLFAAVVAPELHGADPVDWIVAGKVAKYARKAGVSGVRFNMGATYFGAKEVREPSNFEGALERWLGEVRRPPDPVEGADGARFRRG